IKGATPDVTGPYIQGRPGERFIYLSWITVDDAHSATMFRRAKLWLDSGVPNETLLLAARQGELLGRLGLTAAKGTPLFVAVRPPSIEWSCPGLYPTHRRTVWMAFAHDPQFAARPTPSARQELQPDVGVARGFQGQVGERRGAIGLCGQGVDAF